MFTNQVIFYTLIYLNNTWPTEKSNRWNSKSAPTCARKITMISLACKKAHRNQKSKRHIADSSSNSTPIKIKSKVYSLPSRIQKRLRKSLQVLRHPYRPWKTQSLWSFWPWGRSAPTSSPPFPPSRRPRRVFHLLGHIFRKGSQTRTF